MSELDELLWKCSLLSEMKQIMLGFLDLGCAEMRSEPFRLVTNGCSKTRDETEAPSTNMNQSMMELSLSSTQVGGTGHMTLQVASSSGVPPDPRRG